MQLKLTPQQRQIVDQATEILRQQMVYPDTRLTCSEQAAQYLQHKLADEQQQVFGVIFLDSKHRVITDRVLFRGTITRCSVHARGIAQHALACGAVKVILYSNDPKAEAINIDLSMVRQARAFRDALGLIDVLVIDQLVVSGMDTQSFVEKGLL